MRVLIVDTCYSGFLDSVCAEEPGLCTAPYAVQWQALMDRCFGTADYYSRNLQALGHDATEVIANAEILQRQWAAEHGVRPPVLPWRLRWRRGIVPWPERAANAWFLDVLRAQVAAYRPDVVHVQDMAALPPAFLRRLRPFVRLLTGQIASPHPAACDFSEYDLIFSSMPHFVERFQAQGLRADYLNLGFDPTVLPRLRPEPGRYRVVFVGGLSQAHAERIRFLDAVASTCPLDLWGYGAEQLSPGSPLRARHHGPAWGLKMYDVLASADIVLNHHIDAAGPYANNMRLYEATGVGAFLLTDAKANLADLFAPGQEVEVYADAQECAAKIGSYLQNPEARGQIARRGQGRTLRDHTYRHRMVEFAARVHALLESSAGKTTRHGRPVPQSGS